MNAKLSGFARAELKSGLLQCTDEEQYRFKRMYAHGKLWMSINDIVDNMEDEKLDWAMQQVENTLKKKR